MGEKWRKMGEIWGRNGRETAVAEWRWTQRQLMAALDTDRSGTIDKDEFLKLFAETNAAKQSVA